MATAFSALSHAPHQPSQNRTIPRKLLTPLPPLSKGGGLKARHKLLLCCFLLAICPPFLYCKLFCRQDGGIAPNPHHQLDFPHYPTRFSYCNRLCAYMVLHLHYPTRFSYCNRLCAYMVLHLHYPTRFS